MNPERQFLSSQRNRPPSDKTRRPEDGTNTPQGRQQLGLHDYRQHVLGSQEAANQFNRQVQEDVQGLPPSKNPWPLLRNKAAMRNLRDPMLSSGGDYPSNTT